MKIYAVGGAVRDEVLGLPVTDRDYVVVGATPDEMVGLGYKPVGRDFPVFLHPRTHEEYALARTERKTARGYHGFEFHAAPEVTLEQDLARRDLSINAIAKDEAGNVVDPFNGIADLKARVLRHIGPAFVEDPVRILRVARFAARFDFAIAPETMKLMREMVANGEADALVAERVWQELARGLMERTPSKMFLALRQCGALAKILPEVERLFGVPQTARHHPEIDTGVHVLLALDYAAARGFPLPVRFAVLAHDLGKGATPVAEWPRHIGHEARSVSLAKTLSARLKVPHDCRDLALLAARFHGDVHRALELKPSTVLKLLESTDAFRKPDRLEQLLAACECDMRGRSGREQEPYPQARRLRTALVAAAAVDAGKIARQCSGPAQIKARVHQARVQAVRRAPGTEEAPTRSPSRKGAAMIDLYTWTTPNGRKVSIMLEELALPYRVHAINIGQDEQFKPEYLAINPNGKIPSIVDPDGPGGESYAMMESGAILVYLAGKTGKLLPKSERGKFDALQWLMFQMGGVGPMFGQTHHFLRTAKEQVPYAIERYKKETRRLYGVLDRHLAQHEYLAEEYSIADIATYPWVARYEWHQVDLADFPHVQRWFGAISARPAVQRGMKVPA